MEDNQEKPWRPEPRIRYAVDQEAATDDLPRLSRSVSVGSQMSIQSVHSVTRRRGSIDPATALPIQYRTL